MAFDLDTIREKVKARTQDDAEFISLEEIERIIQSSLDEISLDVPLEVVKDISGDGTQDYQLPSEFEDQYSDIVTVEFPADQNPPVFREKDDDWFFYKNPTKPAGQQLRLRFKASTPSTSDIIRVVITTPYTLTAALTTLTRRSSLALEYKTLNEIMRALAAHFSQTSNPTIDADAVDYAGRSQNYLFLAERYLTAYKKIAGLIAQQVKPSQSIKDIDIVFSHGEDFLFHPARTR